MYQDFFSLKEQPFSISPDPDFLFLSDRHKEALAHLMYGLQGNGGFVLLTGEVGTGKTTVCRALLEDISDKTDIAFILNPAQTEIELLATICDQLNIAYDVERASLKVLFDAISSWMLNNLDQGRSAIVLIDEAQHLSFSVLEQLRLLTNIESNNKKPLQVILIGQTELQQKLKENQLRQLAQRITARYHLLPLNLQETEYYIQHRLNVAGASYPIFETKLLKRIFKYSGGIPRLINLICDRSMLCAYTLNSPKVTAKMIDSAVKEMDLSLDTSILNKPFKQIWRVVLLILLVIFTAVQAPKIIHYFNQPQQALDGIAELGEALSDTNQVDPPVVIDDRTSTIVDNGEAIAPIVSESSIIDQQASLPWFDAYPELDLNNNRFTNALKTLYAVWGYEVSLNNVSCDQGEGALLQCFSEKTSLQKLELLNYPAVIELVNDEDSVYTVLYQVGKNYQLLIGSQMITVTKKWLLEYWSGESTILWKTPINASNPLKFGEKGDRVFWLSSHLNRLAGLPDGNKTRFDWKLKSQVIEFQENNNLVADGIAGKQTLMLLLQQTDSKVPSLL
ncbi:AAA family ATPase [Psychromonas aquatilis]|uniref:AAA family ATPase n=1 Tax=Psychromonas aquatilis TaxID=2005072 RepID=A0ABU9GM58_9GAMM